jgi:hypothetical protein
MVLRRKPIWSSNAVLTADVSTRSSAKPPPVSSTMIQAVAIRIMRREREPVTRT